MTLAELARLVAASHDRHFGHTTRRERLRDLAAQVAELVHAPSDERQRHELGDVGWALVQLSTELGLPLDEAIGHTLARLDAGAPGKRVCLLGMSANPITNAHLTIGLEVLALTDVDEVWYYLAGEHPWGKRLMPGEHRLEMVRRAIARYPRMKAFDFELVHGAEIYARTRETAEILRDFILPAFPQHRFSWVMGSDVARSFHTWGGAAWMAEHLDITIFHRLGHDFDKAASILAEPRHVYLRDNVVTSNISSTLVRERGRRYEHDQLVALVPDVVWDYLVEHRLLDEGVLR